MANFNSAVNCLFYTFILASFSSFTPSLRTSVSFQISCIETLKLQFFPRTVMEPSNAIMKLSERQLCQ